MRAWYFFNDMNKKGLLVVISAPSGGGKDSVIRELIKRIPHSARCVTTTSRPPRPGNVEGLDYYFISEAEFLEKIKRGAFVEYNTYAGNYYGTEKAVLERALETYDVVYTQVEINGKRSFDRLQIPHLSIFLKPSDLEVLRDRIIARGGHTREEIDERLEIARHQIAEAGIYDFCIVNEQGKFEDTVYAVMQAIMGAQVRK